MKNNGKGELLHLKSRGKQKRLQTLKWFISSKILCNEDEGTQIKEDKPFETLNLNF